MKQCYAELAISNEESTYICKKGLDIISSNPNSNPLFKHLDKEATIKFINDVSQRIYSDYFLVAFKDTKDQHIVGACLLSLGSPWYNRNLRVLNEECTVAFERGYGITRAIVTFLEGFLKGDLVDVIQTSSANDCVAKLIENTYNKYGFKQYKSYYKCR